MLKNIKYLFERYCFFYVVMVLYISEKELNMADKIVIKGAKENNLKNIDLTIPRDKFIVFTGLSGSGKSSLAFDTIYAEGQRKYVESLSSYARQFLGQMSKPDVESIEGLSPAISIDQKTTNRNPRSTVGTVTEIYDYYRLMYARIGIAHCPKCGKEIKPQSIDTIISDIYKLSENERLYILAPVVRGEKGTHKKLFEQLKKDGYLRVVVDGQTYELDNEINLQKNKKHSVSVVIDRLKLREENKSRLTDSVESALSMADGLVIIKTDKAEEMYSENYACPECGIAMENFEPRSFSFNSPFGMCMECTGLGFHQRIDKDLLVPDMSLSINEGALSNFVSSDDSTYYATIIRKLCDKYDFGMDSPLESAPKEFIDALFYGELEPMKINFYSHFGGWKEREVVFEGMIPNYERRYRESFSESMKTKIGFEFKFCGACGNSSYHSSGKYVLYDVYELYA